jgi:hypothetical protein
LTPIGTPPNGFDTSAASRRVGACSVVDVRERVEVARSIAS